jgi:hypothetical protein
MDLALLAQSQSAILVYVVHLKANFPAGRFHFDGIVKNRVLIRLHVAIRVPRVAMIMIQSRFVP